MHTFNRLFLMCLLSASIGCGVETSGRAIDTLDAGTDPDAMSALGATGPVTPANPTDLTSGGAEATGGKSASSVLEDAGVGQNVVEDVDASTSDALGADMMMPPVDASLDAAMVPESDALPPRMCDEDTDALQASAVGAFGPASRISRLDVPMNAAAADVAGCSVEGAKKGSGLQQLLNTFNVNLTDEFQANDEGLYDTIILLEAAEWVAGQTGSQHEYGPINFYSAKQNADGRVLIERDSYMNDNPEESPLISFEGDTRCSRIETTPGEFSLSLNVSEGNDALIRLKQTRLRGAIAVGDDGLTVTDAHLGGYLTRESVSQLLGDLQAICSAPNAPDFCIALVLFMNNPDGVVDTFMGGYDSYVGPDGAIDGQCQIGACNAVSVCLLMAGEPMKIDGIEEVD